MMGQCRTLAIGALRVGALGRRNLEEPCDRGQWRACLVVGRPCWCASSEIAAGCRAERRCEVAVTGAESIAFEERQTRWSCGRLALGKG